MKKLAEKMKFGTGLKQVITNQFNFTDIENPFLNSDMTLQNLKKERHQRWLEKKEARRETIKTQMKDLEKKLLIYKKYQKEQGVTFTA